MLITIEITKVPRCCLNVVVVGLEPTFTIPITSSRSYQDRLNTPQFAVRRGIEPLVLPG